LQTVAGNEQQSQAGNAVEDWNGSPKLPNPAGTGKLAGTGKTGRGWENRPGSGKMKGSIAVPVSRDRFPQLVFSTMPASFESVDLKFLYPDNWSLVSRDKDDGSEGVTLELPSGGFFSIERELEGKPADQVIDEIASSISQDYGDVEREDLVREPLGDIQRSAEFHFYYLDLLIISRLMVLNRQGKTYVVQMQAESREFDRNQMVFDAILKQLSE
jgi:hypothetical protein